MEVHQGTLKGSFMEVHQWLLAMVTKGCYHFYRQNPVLGGLCQLPCFLAHQGNWLPTVSKQDAGIDGAKESDPAGSFLCFYIDQSKCLYISSNVMPETALKIIAFSHFQLASAQKKLQNVMTSPMQPLGASSEPKQKIKAVLAQENVISRVLPKITFS